MLRRDTPRYGEVDIYADTEFVVPSIDGMATTIPFSSKWDTLLIQASGGLDSTLLVYLTASLFAKNNFKVKILPFSMEVPSKAKSLKSSRAVLQKIQELTNYDYLLPAVEIIMPQQDSLDPIKKDEFFRKSITEQFRNRRVSFEFNGNTKNPPEFVRQSFPDDKYRQLARDNRKTVYNANCSASPHALNDKKGIISLYIKENILDVLAPSTLSCDMNISEIIKNGWSVPCHRCWWCYERQYGFSSNNILDPAPTLPFDVHNAET